MTIAIAQFSTISDNEPEPQPVERYKLKCLPFGGHTAGYVELDQSGRWWYDYSCRHKMCWGSLRFEIATRQVESWRAEGKLELSE